MRVFRRSAFLGEEVLSSHTPPTARVSSPETTALLSQDLGPVLVAVDGRPSGWRALEWAAAEAAARECSLLILHCIDPHPVSWDVFGTFSADQWDADTKDVGALVLREATDRAHAVSASLPIVTHLLMGPPAAALLQACAAGTQIVLGRGRPSGRACSLSASVSEQVTRRARCPVAIIELSDAPTCGRSAGRIVVGFDRTGVPALALGYAFRAAQRRGVGVTALQIWARSSSTRLDASVRNALTACRDAFPDVDVREQFATGSVGPALAAESAGAALVVLASRAHGPLRPESFKSVASLMRSAQSPIAIVGADRPRRKRRTRSRKAD
jgi:nucleotide-binding universal stress UspA family protein